MRPDCRGGIPPSARDLAKADATVQPRSPRGALESQGKAAGDNRRLFEQRRVGEIALVAVRYSSRVLKALPVATIHPARPAMLPAAETMMTAHATRLPAVKPRKHDKAMLLTLVEALVERASRTGEFLERRSALAHHVGTKIEPLDRILRAIGAGARGKSLRALLGEFAQRAFHRRPVFLLFGRELEPGMKRSDARVTKSRDVFRGRAPALHAFELGRTL